jgi:hypothetical protein
MAVTDINTDAAVSAAQDHFMPFLPFDAAVVRAALKRV